MLATIECESPRSNVNGVTIYDATKKSDYNELSYGLAQWNLNAGNPDLEGQAVTKEEATNAVYSVDLMAKYFSQGDAHIWSCYKKLYG